MKKFITLVLLVAIFTGPSPVWAFLYEVPEVTKEEIKSLSDADIMNAYIEAKIELDASRSFHGEAGFTPKEYKRHKQLLSYIIKLRLEMQLREIEVPPIEDWIR